MIAHREPLLLPAGWVKNLMMLSENGSVIKLEISNLC